MFTQYISLCHCHTSTNVYQRHDCCHCEEHEEDCFTHRFALDHECAKGRNIYVEYIVVTPYNSIGTQCHISNIGVKLSYMSTAQESDHEAIRDIISSIRHTEPWLDGNIKSIFCPSTDALRAPPVLV